MIWAMLFYVVKVTFFLSKNTDKIKYISILHLPS